MANQVTKFLPIGDHQHFYLGVNTKQEKSGLYVRSILLPPPPLDPSVSVNLSKTPSSGMPLKDHGELGLRTGLEMAIRAFRVAHVCVGRRKGGREGEKREEILLEWRRDSKRLREDKGEFLRSGASPGTGKMHPILRTREELRENRCWPGEEEQRAQNSLTLCQRGDIRMLGLGVLRG